MKDDGRDLDVERQLEAWAVGHPSASISPELARKVRNALERSLTPVRPVPSQRRLLAMFLAVFVAGSVLLIAFLGRTGVHLMTRVQIAATSAILAGGGIFFAAKLAKQMIPGSRSRMPLSLILTLPGMAVFVGMATLFPWHTSGNFVSEGWPCAAMELAIVIPATVLFWIVARKGALFGSAGLGATLTGLAAFLVLIPLQYQCMFQQAPHLLFWHAGTALLTIGLGALTGSGWRGRRIS